MPGNNREAIFLELVQEQRHKVSQNSRAMAVGMGHQNECAHRHGEPSSQYRTNAVVKKFIASPTCSCFFFPDGFMPAP